MTPVYKTPSHSGEEQKSTVFCDKTMGKVIAVFWGEECRENAQEFCDKYSPSSQAVAVAKPKKASTDHLFDQFWASGIRKSNKKKARLAFDRALPREGKPFFTDRLCRDIAARIHADQLGFTEMHPTTYLNGERWEDEIKPREDARQIGGMCGTEIGDLFGPIEGPSDDGMALLLAATRAKTLEYQA